MTKASGYELVQRVLFHPNGGVQALIQLAQKQETDWLEFKAAIREPGDDKTKRADLAWHVARALIAMINTTGGAVMLGVDDRGDIIGLDASDPDGVITQEGMEAFIRTRIYPQLFPRTGKWNMSRGQWSTEVTRFEQQIEIRPFTVNGQSVLVVLAKPMETELLEVSHTDNQMQRHVVFVRRQGIGEVHEITSLREGQDYAKGRHVSREDLFALSAPFCGIPLRERRTVVDGRLISAGRVDGGFWELRIEVEDGQQKKCAKVIVPEYLAVSAEAASVVLDCLIQRQKESATQTTWEAHIKLINAREHHGTYVFPESLVGLQRNYPLLVVQPSFLINVTALVHFDYCPRNYLMDRYTQSSTNSSMMRGTIVHEVFGAMIKDPDDVPRMLETCRNGMQEQIPSLMMQGKNHEDHYEAIKPHLNALIPGIKTCIPPDEVAEYFVERFMINTDLGLKGKIDALLHLCNDHWRAIELKTAKPWDSKANDGHIFQVAAYQLLLAKSGLSPLDPPCVLYTGTNAELIQKGQKTLLPATMFNEVAFDAATAVRIMNLRNDVIRIEYTGMIPFNETESKCKGCIKTGRISLCASLNQFGLVGGDCHSSVLQSCLNENQVPTRVCEFFTRYNGALLRELQMLRIKHGELLQTPVEERKKQGRCLAVKQAEGTLGKGMLILHFSEQNKSEFREGDPCLLSDAEGPLGGNCLEVYLQDISKEEARITLPSNVPDLWFEPALLDANAPDSAYERNFAALYLLASSYKEPSHPLHALLNVLVDPSAVFEPNKAIQDSMRDGNDHHAKRLLPAQQQAVDLARGLGKLLLVQGPPGTGKTFTLARMVKALVEQGKNVLIATYTHRAADEVISKLAECRLDIPVRKLGRLEACATRNQNQCLEFLLSDEEVHGMAPPSNKEALMQQLDQVATHTNRVLTERAVYIGTTQAWLSGKYDNLLVKPDGNTSTSFDVVVVDEASQIILPNLVGVLRLAEKWILVGDHQQLPPVVSEDAAGILGKTLFEILAERFYDAPTQLVCLDVQHRMHKTIAEFIGQNFYNAKLTTASSCDQWSLPLSGDHILLDSKHRLVLINVNDDAERIKHLRYSEPEARWIAQRLKEVFQMGLPCIDKNGRPLIGVIAPFRAQVSLIRQYLEQELQQWGDAELWSQMVDTVDRFQGDEREIILFSLCMDRRDQEIPKPYRDARRINVALSRAKSKLCIIGDMEAMQMLPIFDKLGRYASGASHTWMPEDCKKILSHDKNRRNNDPIF